MYRRNLPWYRSSKFDSFQSHSLAILGMLICTPFSPFLFQTFYQNTSPALCSLPLTFPLSVYSKFIITIALYDFFCLPLPFQSIIQ